MKLSYYSITEKAGRQINEDSVLIASSKKRNIFIVADGLGGHSNGQIASKICVETAKEIFLKRESCSLSNLIEEIFADTQKKILELVSEFNPSPPKTTAVILITEENRAIYAHVGDSRLYFFRNNNIHSHTLDHSVPQMLVNAGKIKPKDIRRHPDRNRLLSALGDEHTSPKYEISEILEILPNDAFLLCSDGFWEKILEKHMLKTLRSVIKNESNDPAKSWLDALSYRLTSQSGDHKSDNYSAISVIT